MADAVLSGSFMGISGMLAKLVMMRMNLTPDLGLLIRLIQEPLLWLSGAFGVVAFFYLQKAMFRKNISSVVPTVSAFSMIVPIILSVIMLNEYVSLTRWTGVGMIILGIIGISKEEKRTLVYALIKNVRRKMNVR